MKTMTYNDIRKAAKGIQEYVSVYSDDDYPDEKLTALQRQELRLAVTAINRYLKSEGQAVA